MSIHLVGITVTVSEAVLVEVILVGVVLVCIVIIKVIFLAAIIVVRLSAQVGPGPQN